MKCYKWEAGQTYPCPVELLRAGVVGRTLCVGGTDTEREGEEEE